MPGICRNFDRDRAGQGRKFEAISDFALIVKQQDGKPTMDRQHQFPAIGSSVPMRADVRSGFHRIEKTLHRGIKRRMNIQILAEPREASSVLTDLLEFLMGDDPALHANVSG